ncbi:MULTISPECIES: glycosyltransferase family 9 protein [unclassified Campylobacter]|uniref:glycosyltransferase family 9 protein n=1 Tax=unclassified Campylobacter TaxID=2593542 RepID=UPI001237C78A|nr:MULTISPECIES: glycosyltransferase family 9 protein [unclassified Campylobacter]KAA6227058.1 hypothetical protein FMM55_03650 [Campylobacter sp. LR196d]KAA6227629.1 hypothetical protein FMM57_04195 [Campylobacter sp. LR286c]KAA6230738.1 hypothetical protein FMM58_04825 [Campylobacter sp. LR291e]
MLGSSPYFKRLSVGLYCPYEGLSDLVVSLKLLYALKYIYNAKVIVFGSKVNESLARAIEFIDEYVELSYDIKYEKDKRKNRDIINEFMLDYIIPLRAGNKSINFLKSTNAKFIIIRTKEELEYSSRFIFVNFENNKKLQQSNEFLRVLYRARSINSALFDKEISKLSFDIDIQTKKKHKEKIDNFFKNINNPLNSILISPFAKETKYNLRLKDYIKFIKEARTKYPYLNFIVLTNEKTHENFLEHIDKIDEKLLKSIYIFKNDGDILNICELLKRVKCLIAPSSGTMYLATILKINSIGLYSLHDTVYWESFNKNYVLLEKIKDGLNKTDIQNAIGMLLFKLAEFLRK